MIASLVRNIRYLCTNNHPCFSLRHMTQIYLIIFAATSRNIDCLIARELALGYAYHSIDSLSITYLSDLRNHCKFRKPTKNLMLTEMMTFLRHNFRSFSENCVKNIWTAFTKFMLCLKRNKIFNSVMLFRKLKVNRKDIFFLQNVIVFVHVFLCLCFS